MDKAYADTVRLLLRVAPDVFSNDIFAMKGGTAINLFVRDMPRLSVDIDLVYRLWQTPREQALSAITSAVGIIAKRLSRLGLHVRKVASKDLGETKLIIENEESQVKIEVNAIFRGTVLPVEIRALSPKTAEMFSSDLKVPMLAADELYGSKLVAAMDRQHPRDLFDVCQLFESDGLSEAAVECFVTYLAGHNRPIHEVLFGNDKDLTDDYHNNFVGMTMEPVSLDTLVKVRSRLRSELPRRLNDRQRRFLIGLAQAEPKWELLECPHAAELPALRWKLANLQNFKSLRPDDFKHHSQILGTKLEACRAGE